MYTSPFLDLPPLQTAQGTVVLPGSKSISNRVLLLAALSEGTTTVHDLLASDDTQVMLEALQQLGCRIEYHGSLVTVQGLGGKSPAHAAKLFLGNAGTAMRPLTAALALLGGDFELRGVPRMHERPIGDLVDALRQLGCQIDYLGQAGFPPLRIGQPQFNLDAPIRVRGDVSSQFLTALLLALPLVAKQDITVEVVGELISKPYVEMTLKLLQRFGITVAREGWQRFTVPAGGKYRSPGDIHVEADASSASYFIALGAIAALPDSEPLRIEGVGEDAIQGDIRFIEAARAMGADIRSGGHWLEVRRGSWPLKAVDMDCNHIPDAAMTLAVMALYAQGTTTLRNIASWRVKETDRIAAMTNELRKLGATVEAGADFISVTPPTATQWQAASIHTYDDHRMAMCFSLAAFNPARLPVRIEDPHCVAKTFPEYFETLFSVVELPVSDIPVICIDGPTASGKGTLAFHVSQRLGYHYLDSGSLYRATALAAQRAGIAFDDEAALAKIAATLPVRFDQRAVLLNEDDVSDAIRAEVIGLTASQISAFPKVRQALIELQHSFRQLPGLVADGRDMGTVIFPDAQLKVFLTAGVDERAQRRYQQLVAQNICVKIQDLQADLKARDARDSSRPVAPLKPAEDAVILDNSNSTAQASLEKVLAWWQTQVSFKADTPQT